jgi:hypothetical protein
MKKYGQLKILRAFGYYQQTVMNLRGRSSSTSALNGEALDEDEALKWAKEEGDDAFCLAVRRAQVYIATYFADYRRAAEIALAHGDKAVALAPGHFGNVEVAFACALSCLAATRCFANKTKYRNRGVRFAKLLKKWHENDNPNCVAHDALLDAERCALDKKESKALKNYEVAVLLAGRRGLVNLQALCNERFADYLVICNDINEASYRFNEAIRLYEEWGASKKVEQLKERIHILSCAKKVPTAIEIGP